MRSIACFAIVFLWLATLLSQPGYGDDRAPKALRKIKKLYVAQIKINARSLEDKDELPYLQLDFVGKHFYEGLLKGFSNKHIELKMGEMDLNRLTFKDTLSQKVIYAPNNIYFPYNFSWKHLDKSSIESLNKATGTSYSLIMELKNSLWRQELKGKVAIYSGHKRLSVLYVDAVSTYIIRDAQSPYLSEYDTKFATLNKQGSHKEEIAKVYKELGTLVGKQIKEDIYPAKKVKKRGLSEFIAYKKKEKETRKPLSYVANPYPPEESQEAFKAPKKKKKQRNKKTIKKEN